MSELGDYLKKLRGNVSLREASKRSGISHSYINSLEAGTHPRTGAPINPTPDILRGLAKAYNHSYEDLMKLAGYVDEEGNVTGIEETESDLKRKKAKELLSRIKPEKLEHTLFLLEQLNKE